MEKIGFGEQPYLVYQHLDAGHPHIHIVTTNIQSDGKRISLHNIGRNQSAKARKEIEIAFKLVKAEDQKKQQSEEIKPFECTKIELWKISNKKRNYKCSGCCVSTIINMLHLQNSMQFLNYIIWLPTGEKKMESFSKRMDLFTGYWMKREIRSGFRLKRVPFTTSQRSSYLEKKFKENEILKQEHKKNLKTSIDWIMIKPPKTFTGI